MAGGVRGTAADGLDRPALPAAGPRAPGRAGRVSDLLLGVPQPLRQGGDTFVGVDNYQTMFASKATLTAIKNTLIWVVIAPTVVTAIGLVFAVLSERISWSTAFKVVVFMPMAVSFLSAGVTWRLIYEENPNLGLANAAARGIANIVRPPGGLPGARPSEEDLLQPQGGAYVTSGSFSPGDTAELGLVAIPPEEIPPMRRRRRPRRRRPSGIAGTVWLDFTTGGGGEKGRSTRPRRACPASTWRRSAAPTSRDRRRRTRRTVRHHRPRAGRLPAATGGVELPSRRSAAISWLGPTLVTPRSSSRTSGSGPASRWC